MFWQRLAFAGQSEGRPGKAKSTQVVAVVTTGTIELKVDAFPVGVPVPVPTVVIPVVVATMVTAAPAKVKIVSIIKCLTGNYYHLICR